MTRRWQRGLVGFALLGAGLAGCGGTPLGPGGEADAGPPPEPFFVQAVVPADGAYGVEPDIRLTVRFSRAVDPASVNGQTIRLLREPTLEAVAGSYGCSEQDELVTFDPAPALLVADAAYRLVLTSAIRAADGAELDLTRTRVPLPSRFRTRQAPDEEPPVFSSTERSAEALGPGEVRLRWAPARDPDDRTLPLQLVYAIYQGQPPAPVDFVAPLALVARGATEAVVRGLAAHTEYAFVVRARDLAGNEDRNTVEVRVRTLAQRVPVELTLLFTGGVGGKIEPCG